MGTPEFITKLRRHIGHDSLWLTGVTAVVVREGHVLLVFVSAINRWAPVTGIIDPGEEPADAAVREVREEAGVVCQPVRLASVEVDPPVVHPSGDHAQYLNLTFACEWASGEPRGDGHETTDARWFPLDNLPPLRGRHARRIQAATSDEERARFSFAS